MATLKFPDSLIISHWDFQLPMEMAPCVVTYILTLRSARIIIFSVQLQTYYVHRQVWSRGELLVAKSIPSFTKTVTVFLLLMLYYPIRIWVFNDWICEEWVSFICWLERFRLLISGVYWCVKKLSIEFRFMTFTLSDVHSEVRTLRFVWFVDDSFFNWTFIHKTRPL